MNEQAIKCSVGVMAHNEERNIEALLDRLALQNLSRAVISEIIVVASGCDDSTVEIVKRIAALNPSIKLLCEPERKGKASAINTFIAAAKEQILVVVGADTLPDHNAVENLVEPLKDTGTGMTGARPVPLNTRDTYAGFTVNFLWELHHQASLKMPKCGEMVAFRKVFDALPPDTVVDEPQIEALVRERGLCLRYAPDAVVYNLGPSSVREIIMRRRSIVAGYERLSRVTDYRVSTHELRGWLIKYVTGKIARREYPLFKTFFAIMIELISRALGAYDAKYSKKPLHLWEHARSTKAPASVVSSRQ